MEISTAPPIEPAMMERRGLGLLVVVAGFCWDGGWRVETLGGAVVVIVDVGMKRVIRRGDGLLLRKRRFKCTATL